MELTTADQACILQMFSVARLVKRPGMACDLVAFLTGVTLVALRALVMLNFVGGLGAYPRFVESATNAYPLAFAHSVGFFSLLLLERASAF